MFHDNHLLSEFKRQPSSEENEIKFAGSSLKYFEFFLIGISGTGTEYFKWFLFTPKFFFLLNKPELVVFAECELYKKV